MINAHERISFLAPLFVPATRPDRYFKAASSGADGIIIDLEDAVAVNEKDAARETLRTASLPPNSIVRVNAFGTRWHEADVVAMKDLDIAGIMLPKAETAGHLESVRAVLGNLPVISLIESAHGVAGVREVEELLAAEPADHVAAEADVDERGGVGNRKLHGHLGATA